MSHRPHRGAVVLTAAALITSLVAAPTASARPEPQPLDRIRSAVRTADAPCRLERIGTQLVRCSDLTGNGVEAPSWVPEQEPRLPRRWPSTATTGWRGPLP